MLDHQAIKKAYPEAITIDDGTGAYDKDGNFVGQLSKGKATSKGNGGKGGKDFGGKGKGGKGAGKGKRKGNRKGR